MFDNFNKIILRSEKCYVKIRRCEIAIYQYEHPKTGEIFEDIRKYKDANKPFIAPDGAKCTRLEVATSFTGWKGDREIFEQDPGYVKSMRPKYIKFRDGHRERYDPMKHC